MSRIVVKNLVKFVFVFEEVLRFSHPLFIGFGLAVYEGLELRRLASVLPYRVIAFVRGCGERVNRNKIALVKPKRDGRFKLLARCPSFCDRQTIVSKSSGAHRILFIIALLCASACGAANGSDSSQFRFNIFLSDVLSSDQFGKQEHVDNICIQRAQKDPSAWIRLGFDFGEFNVLFPIDDRCFNRELAQVPALVVTAVDNGQDPPRHDADKSNQDARERDDSGNNLRVSEYGLQILQGGLLALVGVAVGSLIGCVALIVICRSQSRLR